MKDLGYRWGSCGSNGAIYIHWCTLCLPPGTIEYILAHELVHLLQPHHDEAFQMRLEQILPDHRARRQWLAEEGGKYI